MPSRDLPANVKSIVAEIETEIGEEDPASASTSALAPAAAIEGDGAAGAAMGAGNRRVEAAVRGILREIGEDPDREGLLGTPGRVHRMYAGMPSPLVCNHTSPKFARAARQARSPSSNTATRFPRSATPKAMAAPTMPPPTTTTS